MIELLLCLQLSDTKQLTWLFPYSTHYSGTFTFCIHGIIPTLHFTIYIISKHLPYFTFLLYLLLLNANQQLHGLYVYLTTLSDFYFIWAAMINFRFEDDIAWVILQPCICKGMLRLMQKSKFKHLYQYTYN